LTPLRRTRHLRGAIVDSEGVGYHRRSIRSRPVRHLKIPVLPFVLLCAFPVAAQEKTAADNPLAALNDQLKEVLSAAGVPFTPEQERAIALMMEERRRAAEELFGDLMDFRAGPTRGQEEDRLRSAIEWVRREFITQLREYLTPQQLTVWTAAIRAGPPGEAGVKEPPRAAPRAETQYVRINNNAFTAEDVSFRGGGGGQGTEVIQRGGAGAWHGNSQFLLKDDALNARNPFAGNKPSYQERRLSVDVSGPTIRGRLTSTAAFTQSETDNVDTVRATLPEGVFALGITRPNVFRQVNSRNTLQLSDAHSVTAFVRYATETSENEGIGGFTLPERASTSDWRQVNAAIRQFSTLSSRSLFESRLTFNDRHGRTMPATDAPRINVLDAFNRGGAQNRSEDFGRTYDFGTLYTRFGEKLTIKTGLEGAYRVDRTLATSNFGGTFTFSSLDDYLNARPLTYRVNRGTPLIDTSQLEMSAFLQGDLKLTPQLMMMFGARYDAQTNLDDGNNVSPRVGFAYSPGRATVVRGGGGIFYQRLSIGMVENQRRFDGMRQYEIVIDSPSYPDPFASGTIRQTFPSVRVTDPYLVAPYFTVGMISLERTFFSTFLVTASYDYQRELHRFRARNLNAPFDVESPVLAACRAGQPAETCVRPDPARGNIMNLESTGVEVKHNLRLSVRQRFSVVNVSANYQWQRAFNDVPGGAGAAATNSYDLRSDWGRAPFPRHTVNSTVNVRLPLGLFLTGRLSTHSGRYYSITTGTDDNRDTNVTDRPAGVPQNSERGPAYANVDFNISKAFFFRRSAGATGGTNLNVFANMTNAFNRIHYGTPSGVMTSPNFGRSTSAQDPREIEVGVRFQF
jgi:hypothetical protein